MLLTNQAWVIEFKGYKINVVYFFIFALLMYYASTKLEKMKRFISLYYCPLGNQKDQIKSLAYSTENMRLLNMIEISRSEIQKEQNGLRRIAEDDEYEYYVK